MLKARFLRGFTLIEVLVALTVLLAGIAGGTVLLMQCVQHERESATRRLAIRSASSLAEALRAIRRQSGEAAGSDGPVISAWIAEMQSTLPAGATARVTAAGADASSYRISIVWPVAGSAPQELLLPVTP